MQLKATSSIFFLLLLFSCAQVKNSQQQRIVPNAIPVLHITNDTTATAIKISSLAIDIKVAANTAVTTFDIVFYNPNNRILEGEFEFPLADGQHIVRYALDIEGKLREGVVVEKAKARVAYESTIRRVIDPGLVEKTKGNNFRTRIYPLPAKGSRHILIAVEQTLEQLNKELFYQLPLHTLQPIENFSVKAAVIKSTERPAPQEHNLTNFQFDKWENGWMASYNKKNFTSTQSIAFAIPYSAANETTTLTENYKGQTFFYVNNRMEPAYQQKKAPATIGILWDVSASGEKRNIEKEKQLLEQYLSGDVQVIFIPFNVYAQEKEEFTISNGNSKALLKRIDALRYDGGTQFGTIDLTKYTFDEVLLFSDGLSNFGKKEMMLSAMPVMTISSSGSADYSNLKFIAQQSHGKFIDLTKMEVPAAAEAISNLSLQVIRMEFDPAAMEDVVAQVSPVQSSGLSIAGKLKVPSAELRVMLVFGTEVVTTKTFTITRPENSEYDQVKRIWASMKIEELDLQFEKNKTAITKLGKDFSIVTQNTSLLVLDRVEDYVEHEITPPAELLKEYTALLATKLNGKRNEKAEALDNAVYVMNELKEWWSRNYSPAKQKKPEAVITEENLEAVAVVDSAVTRGSTEIRFSAPVIEADKMVGTDSVAGLINPGVGSYYYIATDSTRDYFANGNALTFSTTQEGEFFVLGEEAKMDEASNTISNNSIELNEWKPEAPYLKELEKY